MSFLLSLLISSRLSHAVMLWKKYICYFALVSSFCSNFVSLDFVVDAIRCRGWFPFTLLLALFSIIRQHLNFHYIDYRCIYLHSSSSVYVMACRCFAPAHAMQIAHSLSLSLPLLFLSICWYFIIRYLFFPAYRLLCFVYYFSVYIEMPTTHLNKTREYLDAKFHSQCYARLANAVFLASDLE